MKLLSELNSRLVCSGDDGRIAIAKLRDGRIVKRFGSRAASAGSIVVWDGRYKYVRGYEKQPMLFDLHDDPLENRNIAAKALSEAARLSKLLI